MTSPFTCPQCGTFVRADWTDTCGVCRAPLIVASSSPADGPRNSVDTHTGGNAVMVVVAAVVMLVVGGGIAFAISGGDPKPVELAEQAQTTVITSSSDGSVTTAAPASMSAASLSKAVEPTPEDVGSTWTKTGGKVNSQSDVAVPSACWPSDSQMSSNVGGSEGDYVYNVASSKGNNGLIFDVTVATSADVSAHQQAQVASASYESCLARADESLVASTGKVKSRNITRVNRTLPVAYAGYKDVMVLSSAEGTGSYTVETVFLQAGRVREKLRFTYCDCSGGAAKNQEAIISAVAAHMRDNQSN